MAANKNSTLISGSNQPILGAAVHSRPRAPSFRGIRRLYARLARRWRMATPSVAAAAADEGGECLGREDGNRIHDARLRRERVIDLQTNNLLVTSIK